MTFSKNSFIAAILLLFTLSAHGEGGENPRKTGEGLIKIGADRLAHEARRARRMKIIRAAKKIKAAFSGKEKIIYADKGGCSPKKHVVETFLKKASEQCGSSASKKIADLSGQKIKERGLKMLTPKGGKKPSLPAKKGVTCKFFRGVKKAGNHLKKNKHTYIAGVVIACSAWICLRALGQKDEPEEKNNLDESDNKTAAFAPVAKEEAQSDVSQAGWSCPSILKSKTFWIVTSATAVVTIASYVGYRVWKKRKEKKKMALAPC